jgi:hypothetical protein
MAPKTKSEIIVEEFLLSPCIRLGRVLSTAILTALFVITMILFGYRGRNAATAPIPNLIQQSAYALPILCFLFVGSIIGILYLYRLNDQHERHRISITDNHVKLRINDHVTIIALKRATAVSFKVMPHFHKLFSNAYHRVGRLSMLYQGRHYTFSFPIRNDHIASQLQRFIQKLGGRSLQTMDQRKPFTMK